MAGSGWCQKGAIGKPKSNCIIGAVGNRNGVLVSHLFAGATSGSFGWLGRRTSIVSHRTVSACFASSGAHECFKRKRVGFFECVCEYRLEAAGNCHRRDNVEGKRGGSRPLLVTSRSVSNSSFGG